MDKINFMHPYIFGQVCGDWMKEVMNEFMVW
jgi:hypothetical protein